MIVLEILCCASHIARTMLSRHSSRIQAELLCMTQGATFSEATHGRAIHPWVCDLQAWGTVPQGLHSTRLPFSLSNIFASSDIKAENSETLLCVN